MRKDGYVVVQPWMVTDYNLKRQQNSLILCPDLGFFILHESVHKFIKGNPFRPRTIYQITKIPC